ncbi:MAG TPA: phosphoribosylglycinamide synthetase C domain-containing protein, partial [Acidimicrobiia bacterium]|nr:phosphoribosylglycinamide synthetase C domain-containing protein [Acidimicrobiia bacterium]
ETGEVIKGLDGVGEDVLVFHGGTKRDGKRLLVAGGRVLNMVGIGPSIGHARERAYEAVSAVNWPGMQFRSDIAASTQS